MTGRARVLAALSGRMATPGAVVVDYLPLFLAERTEKAYVAAYHEPLARWGRVRIDPDEDVAIRARAIEEAYDCFSEQQTANALHK